MKLTVIGCWGGYPAPGGATSAYLLEKDGFHLLIDVGSGALSRLQKYIHVQAIDAVIVSHYHHDHVADIGVLQYARLVQSYITGEDTVLPIYGHAEDQAGFYALTHDYTKGIAYDPNQVLEVGPFSIRFMKTKHPVPCYGMRISDGEKTIVYTADTAYCDAWIDFVRRADLHGRDCKFYGRRGGSQAGEMLSAEGASVAAEAGVGAVLSSYLAQDGNQADLV